MWHIRRTCIASLICAVAACRAQSNLAAISGIVTDQQGGVVPDAAVVATSVETGVQTSAQTNAAGFYRLQNLPIGAYDVSVEHPGFRRYVRRVTLTTGEQLGLDVGLTVGTTGESITVTAEAPLIESSTSEVNSLIESKSIDALPLGNRRTLNVVQLSGAAVFVSYPNTPANVNPNFSLAAGRTQSQMAWIGAASSLKRPSREPINSMGADTSSSATTLWTRRAFLRPSSPGAN